VDSFGSLDKPIIGGAAKFPSRPKKLSILILKVEFHNKQPALYDFSRSVQVLSAYLSGSGSEPLHIILKPTENILTRLKLSGTFRGYEIAPR
jgi:hypothetical protein